MQEIQRTRSTIDDKEFEYHFNALTVDELFRHYEHVGFIYPEKQRRLAPFCAKVRGNWEAALRAGPEIFCLFSAGNSNGHQLATLTLWRSTNSGWIAQHLTSTGNPFNVRAILLGCQVHGLGLKANLSAQNWFQPENKYASRIFGSITNSLSESHAAVNNYNYLAVKKIYPKPTGSYQISCIAEDPSALFSFASKIRGNLYAVAEELDQPDLELEALNDLYKRVGLHRQRRSWLAFLPGRNEPIAAAIAYSGSLGINFSFLENRCDLMCDATLENDMRAEICTDLLYHVSQFQKALPLGYIPVTTDDRTAMVLIASGASLVRSYSQSIWLRDGFQSWLQHVEAIYRRVERRYVSQCKATYRNG
ncbi:MAG: hypothetical protein V2I56_23665 [Desulfobacteraceae bacterium]|jgi:hypothetical protein|nr:hypothetical protein [Desulfobacteraceae bacterium]